MASFNNVFTKQTNGSWSSGTGRMRRSGSSFKRPNNRDREGLKDNPKVAKKGGGGAKFTWGKPGDEMNVAALSRLDPNYDSEEEDETVVFSTTLTSLAKKSAQLPGSSHSLLNSPQRHNYSPVKSRAAPSLTLPEYKKRIISIATEFFSSEDFEEVSTSVCELGAPEYNYELVKRCITLAMGRGDRERELTSNLLSHLRSDDALVSIEDCGKGFERLFEVIDDLVIDVPRAKSYLAQFLARAIVDEVLPPRFLQDPMVVQLGGSVVEQAILLLSIKHGVVRLERVWDGDGALRPVGALKRDIKLLLHEYIASSDLDEAVRCVRKLNVPRFHHEVVKRAVVIALDKHDRERAMMSTLISELSMREIISDRQLREGFARLYDGLPDLQLDTPGCERILRVFLEQAVNDGCMSVDFANSLILGKKRV